MPQKPSATATRQHNREIAASVTRLLVHHWTADDPVETRQSQIEDWIEDLREFRLATVEDSCREWRRASTRRPLPSDIRRLCIETISRDPEPGPAPDRAELAAKRSADDEAMQREGREIIDRWAQARGFADIDAMAQARGVGWPELYAEQMRETLAGSPIGRAAPQFAELARGLGVSAAEYNPPAAAMAAGRAEIGLPDPLETAQQEAANV